MQAEPEKAAANAQVKLAHSASRLEASAGQQEDSAERRTSLAADRTVLAAERTYAAWVRTGLAALASGVGAKALLEGTVPHFLAMATGSVLIVFAGFCFMAAIWRQMLRVEPAPDASRLPSWLLVIVNLFLVIVSLAALVGVWLQ